MSATISRLLVTSRVIFLAVMAMLMATNTFSEESTRMKEISELLVSLKAQAQEDRVSERVFVTLGKLAAFGTQVLPPVLDELTRETNDSNVYFHRSLVDVIARVPDDRAIRALLDVVLHHRKTDRVFNLNARRLMAMREIRCEVSDTDIQQLIGYVSDYSPEKQLENGDMATILSQCRNLSAKLRVTPIMERFMYHIEHGVKAYSDEFRAAGIGELLTAIGNIGEPGIPFIREYLALVSNEGDEKWLTMALGMAGDSSVAEFLGCVAQSDPDVYARAAAIPAYANAAREKSIPLLTQLTDDKSIVPCPRQFGRTGYPLGEVAERELRKIKRKTATYDTP